MNSSPPHSEADRLLDYAYGELSPTEKDAFETHLHGCPTCSEELASIRGVRRAMARLEDEPAPMQGWESLKVYAEQAARRMQAEPTPRAGRRWRQWLAPLTALAAAGVVAGVAMDVLEQSPTLSERRATALQSAEPPAATAPQSLPPPADVMAAQGSREEMGAGAPKDVVRLRKKSKTVNDDVFGHDVMGTNKPATAAPARPAREAPPTPFVDKGVSNAPPPVARPAEQPKAFDEAMEYRAGGMSKSSKHEATAPAPAKRTPAGKKTLAERKEDSAAEAEPALRGSSVAGAASEENAVAGTRAPGALSVAPSANVSLQGRAAQLRVLLANKPQGEALQDILSELCDVAWELRWYSDARGYCSRLVEEFPNSANARVARERLGPPP
jgi:hypothetical protein